MSTFDASIDPERVPFSEVLISLCDLARDRGVEIVLVGATARDVALAAEGQDEPLRATNDVDVAVVVPDADAFEQLVAGLAPARTGAVHKFLVHGVEVDLVPFGGIERDDRTIIWPDGAMMNTLGFAEALATTLELLLPGGRRMRVASIPAQTAFKVFAWDDRGHWTNRDAVDLRILLHAYSFGARLDHIYAEHNLAVLEGYDFDTWLAGAHWLGVDVRTDLGEHVAQRCRAVVVADQDDGRLSLAMRGDSVRDRQLLAALAAGLQRDPTPIIR